MKFVAVLAALALVPVAAVAGYFAHQDPALPPFGVYAAKQLSVKHVPGQDTDDWLVVAVSGPNKGGAMDLFQALATYPTHKALEQSAQGKVKYVEFKCQNYSTNAAKQLYTARTVIRKCQSIQKSRKQAEKYMVSLIQQRPKG